MLPYIIPDMTARQVCISLFFITVSHDILIVKLIENNIFSFQERDYNTLLPDYEEAIAQSMKQPPPPTYQMAMAYSLGNTQLSGLQVNLENEPTTSANDQPVNVTVNAIINDSPTRTDAQQSIAVSNAPSLDAEPQSRDESANKPYYSY